jgi:FMN reductase
MTEPTIALLGGSLRERSYSRAALHAVAAASETLGARSTLLDLRALNLPMYVPDATLDTYPPIFRSGIERFLDTIYECDAMVWSTPTYHGTLTGAFKNALDFLEFLSGTNPPYLSGKPIGLISINDSKPFAAMASSAQELRAWVTPTQIELNKTHFNDTLLLSDADATRRIRRMLQELIGFVR